MSGTGVPGETANVYDGSTLLGSGVIGAGGSWTVNVALTPGTHTLRATQTAIVGGSSFTSALSNSRSVTAFAPPAAPTVASASGATVTTTATVSGQALGSTSVEIYDGPVLVGTATSAANGNWTSTLAILALGRHTLQARQLDTATGFWSNLGSAFSVTVVPDVPAIVSLSTPGPANPTAAVTVSGTGVAGYTVKVYEGSTVLGSSVVAADGTWAVPVALVAGSHSLTATLTSTPVGGSTFASASSSGASVTVYAPPAAPTLTSSPVNVYAGSPFSVSGHGVAGATVYLYDGVLQIDSALVASNGNWTLSLTLLTIGAHSFTVRQRAADTGFLSATTAFTVTAYANVGAPAITSVSTPAHTHSTASVTMTGPGVAGQTITIYDGSNSIKTVVVASNGTWSTTVWLAVGTHTLTATQSPAAGLESTSSGSRVVTVLWG